MTTPPTPEQVTSTSVQDMRAAIQSLSAGVKTRDVGRCQRCEGYTSSGRDTFCRECAIHVLRDAADAFESATATIARLEGQLTDAVRAMETYRTAWNAEKQRAEAAEQDAKRWQWARQFFSVESDMSSGYEEYLFMHDDKVGPASVSTEYGNTVESLVDRAVAALAAAPGAVKESLTVAAPRTGEDTSNA